MANNSQALGKTQPLSPSVSRALMVLKLLVEHPDGLGVSAISQILGYPKSSLYGVVNTMLEQDFVVKDPNSKRYMLGPQTLIAGSAYARNNELLTLFKRFARRLADWSGETVQLAILQHRSVLYIGKQEGSQIIRLASDVGARLPAHATALGKCLLSGLSKQDLRTLYSGVVLEKLTSNTLQDYNDLENAVEAIRILGYAEDQEETSKGVHCFGAPVFDSNDDVVAAISLSVPVVRLSDARRTELVRNIVSCASEISRHLGYELEDSTSSSTNIPSH